MIILWFFIMETNGKQIFKSSIRNLICIYAKIEQHLTLQEFCCFKPYIPSSTTLVHVFLNLNTT